MTIPKIAFEGTKTITRAFGRVGGLLVKHSPTIMVYGGAAVIGIGIYLFCKSSMHLNEKIDDHDAAIAEIEEKAKNEKELSKMKFHENRHFAWEITKLYGPAVTTTLCGFGLVLGGYNILNKRNAALGVAYKLLEESYSQYRENVRNDVGKEKDLEYLHGLKKEEVMYEEDNGDVGTKEVYEIANPKSHSPYARYYDEFSTKWSRNPEYNLMTLNALQDYANDRLRAVGHVFLNEVYDMLGLPHTQAGSVVGWVYNSKNGDNYIDFGIYDLHDKLKHAFVNGYEPSILLDFNVDGVIYDLI